MDHDLKDVPFPTLQRRAIGGDPAARAAIKEFASELSEKVKPFAGVADALANVRGPIHDPVALADLPSPGVERARREKAMIGELRGMRQAVERAEERERAAEERARAAEDREAASQARSEDRARFMVRLTAASVVVGAIGATATVVAIV